MVASTKSLWETGEVTAQSAVKSSPCKVQPLEHFPCSCRRQGLVPGHNMNYILVYPVVTSCLWGLQAPKASVLEVFHHVVRLCTLEIQFS